MKKQTGITLIALVITIIVLLILAGVSISMVIGENGVLNQADKATIETRKAAAKEDVELAWVSADSDYWNDWTNNSSVKKGDYFEAEHLNKYLVGKGTVSKVVDNGDGTHIVTYTSDADDMVYTIIVDANGTGKVDGEGIHISNYKEEPTEPGAYDVDGNKLYTWEEVINLYGETNGFVYYFYNLKNDSNISMLIIDAAFEPGTGCFSGCTNLKKVIWTGGGFISAGCFAGCTGLEEVEIKDGITSIDTRSFSNCTNLKTITIPDSVTSISAGAFMNNLNLTTIYYNGELMNDTNWGATNATIVNY